MGQIAESYKRWRHTRGYGVHSPYAYSVVKEVVRPGRRYAYYGYDDIDNAIDSNAVRHARRMATTLLRLAAFLRTDTAFIPRTENSSLYLTALKAANSKIKITSAVQEASRCKLVCSTSDLVPLDTLKSLIRTQGRAIAIFNAPDGWKDRLFEEIGEGLMLHGSHNLIVISRPGMQKVSYSVII